MTVEELRAVLAGMPHSAEVWMLSECGYVQETIHDVRLAASGTRVELASEQS